MSRIFRYGSPGLVTGVLLFTVPPVGLVCLAALVMDALRGHGEATRSVTEMLSATSIAAEPRRPRERAAWTKVSDYV